MPPTINETTPPTRQCRLRWLTLHLSHVTGRAVTQDEVVDLALAEMADRTMADILERTPGLTGRRGFEVALMIPLGRA